MSSVRFFSLLSPTHEGDDCCLCPPPPPLPPVDRLFLLPFSLPPAARGPYEVEEGRAKN